MKRVEAIFRRAKLHDVSNALLRIGVEGMTVTEVVGRGYERGPVICYRGAVSEVAFIPHVKLETIVANSEEDAVVDAIFQNAHTGKVGDGRIIVSDIESIVRIRTGEADDTDADFVRHCKESNPAPNSNAGVAASMFAVAH